MTDQIRTFKTRRLEPLSMLWRALAAPQTLMGLLGCLAIALALGAAIPQIPTEARSNPQAWVESQFGLYGPAGGLVSALGLFDIFGSFWFRLLLVCCGLALLVRAVESAELAWRVNGSKGPAAVAFGSWFDHAVALDVRSSLPVAEAQSRAGDSLGRQGVRWAPVPDQAVATLVASRRGPVLWARPVAYCALLLALGGLVVLQTRGWQNADWLPDSGESQAVGHGSPYTLRLDAFDLDRDRAGRLRGYQSQITWLEGDQAIGQVRAGAGQPATRQGITIRQVGFVPQLRVRGWDKAGRPLALQTEAEDVGIPAEVEISFATPQAQPLLFLPRQDLFFVFSFEALCTQGQPALHVDLLRDGGAERQRLQTLHDSGPVPFDGLTLDVTMAYRPILRVDHRPGTALVLAGMVLALLALGVYWLGQPRLARIAVTPGVTGPTLVQVVVQAAMGGRRWASHLAEALREALADGD